jgi:hypothetical protein
MIRIEIKE